MYYADYLSQATISQPYALMDLDDTLFQTKRKLPATDEVLICASVNKQGEPLSFFTQKQASFFHWLSAHTTLIPITARDTTEIQRVKLPFDDFKVLTHGAVILDKDNQPNHAWQTHIKQKLKAEQTTLRTITRLLDDINGFESSLLGKTALSITPHTENFDGEKLTVYLAVKHNQKKHRVLETLAERLTYELPDGFYVHHNANNLAVLPDFVHKRHAVYFLMQNHFIKERPVFGFGDSLADLPFLRLLDWYGTPNKGQLHDNIGQLLWESDHE